MKDEGGGSTERVVGDSWEGAGDSWEGAGDSWESAGEEPLGEGTGVTVLDGSREIISKGFVFTWDDGSIVGGGGGGGGGEGRGGEGGGRGKVREEGERRR
jgi:hypothetical protein